MAGAGIAKDGPEQDAALSEEVRKLGDSFVAFLSFSACLSGVWKSFFKSCNVHQNCFMLYILLFFLFFGGGGGIDARIILGGSGWLRSPSAVIQVLSGQASAEVD